MPPAASRAKTRRRSGSCACATAGGAPAMTAVRRASASSSRLSSIPRPAPPPGLHPPPPKLRRAGDIPGDVPAANQPESFLEEEPRLMRSARARRDEPGETGSCSRSDASSRARRADHRAASDADVAAHTVKTSSKPLPVEEAFVASSSRRRSMTPPASRNKSLERRLARSVTYTAPSAPPETTERQLASGAALHTEHPCVLEKVCTHLFAPRSHRRTAPSDEPVRQRRPVGSTDAHRTVPACPTKRVARSCGARASQRRTTPLLSPVTTTAPAASVASAYAESVCPPKRARGCAATPCLLLDAVSASHKNTWSCPKPALTKTPPPAPPFVSGAATRVT
mmetsp:Transcript_14940/g.63058  ORF Transcript_14940/g.63058 Transcript_14940/m.63058 type:complete len:339 (-) Transcript_14940:953-1969(-)